MDAVFIHVLNRAITAAFMLPAVMLLRLLLKKSPKRFLCLLWAAAAVRLVCPFSFESVFSFIPSAETISLSVVRYAKEPEIHSGIPSLNHVVNPALRASFAPAPGASVNPLQIWLSAAGVLWLAGVAVMLCAALAGFVRLRQRVREAVLWKSQVWICDRVETPFLFGILCPRIYLPSGMEETQILYVLAHEQAHLKRKDHWWKLLAYLLLSVYWFHPLVWAAYILFGRDMEQACDERVIREYDMEQKKNYSRAMVSCSIQKGMVLSCPLAFGEIGVRKRVKAVLGYKEPAGWMAAAAAAVCVAAAVLCWSSKPAARDQGDWDKRPMLQMGDSVENRKLTLDAVEVLAQKGMDLSWEDFDGYTYTETGSGLYIRMYEIDEIFSVWIGGTGYDEEPMYIYLTANDGNREERIDLRMDSVEQFVAAHSKNAAAGTLPSR